LRQSSSAATGLPPLREYVLCALAGLVVLASAGPALPPALPAPPWAISALLYVGATVLAGDFLRRTYPHQSLGLCNIVTQARLVIVTALTAALLAGGVGTLPYVALASVALALDGVDGWLARRHGLTSSFGARFDMETDAAFALVLALNALATGAAGPVVLLLGLMRYAFVAAAAVLPWLNAPLPERYSRKTVCVVQIVVLLAVIAPLLPPGASAALALAGLLVLAASFAIDVAWLAGQRAPPPCSGSPTSR
jgi:phosphatidylglycerophosphate synthase